MPIDVTVSRVRLMLDDPAALAGHSSERWKQLPRGDVDALQLAGLQQRFAELRDAIPVLKKLADSEGVEQIDELDDVVPLLFEHTVYKSYPPSLLERQNFAQINRWLGKLVTPELAELLAAVDVSACRGLDDWFTAMDREVPQLRISHTSGTSGTLSFLPQSVPEWRRMVSIRRMLVWNSDGPDMSPPDLHMAYPYYRAGFLSHVRGVEFLIEAAGCGTFSRRLSCNAEQ